ncbi:MAG: amino acid racemase [Myxococcota bacterium]
MRRLGLVGGVTWHSTATYYSRVNTGIAAALGPFRSADLVLRSLDYGVVRDARRDGSWRPLGDLVVRAARDLRAAGADGVALCSNSLHALAHRVESEVGLPVLHIADALADRALADGHTTLAFFGTGFTMTQPFVRDRLRSRGLEVLVPVEVSAIDRIILEELAVGDVRDASREAFRAALLPLVDAGATAVVLGCTELGMLVGPADVPVPVLDTLALHADAAVAWMLSAPGRSEPT